MISVTLSNLLIILALFSLIHFITHYSNENYSGSLWAFPTVHSAILWPTEDSSNNWLIFRGGNCDENFLMFRGKCWMFSSDVATVDNVSTLLHVSPPVDAENISNANSLNTTKMIFWIAKWKHRLAHSIRRCHRKMAIT